MDDVLKDGQGAIGSGGSPSPETNSTGGDDGWDPQANKPYMRQLGKQWWGNETLRGFDSLNGLVDAYFEAAKPKAPKAYSIEGLDESTAEVFRQLDLSEDGAAKVKALIDGAKPKPVDAEKVLRDRHGDGYGELKSYADKAIAAFSDEGLRELSEEYGLSSNPAFIEVMAKVGRDVGDDFHDHRGDGATKPAANIFWELAKKSTGVK